MLIEMRIPNGGMPNVDYFGVDAHSRITRFAKGYLEGAEGAGTPETLKANLSLMKQAASELYQAGVADRQDAATCVDGLMNVRPGQIPRRDVTGWSFLLSIDRHSAVDCCHFSAQLQPVGRGSTTEDWSALGFFLAEITALTGYAGRPPDPLTPIATTNPNSVLHWAWHSDGSPIDPRTLGLLKEVFQARC